MSKDHGGQELTEHGSLIGDLYTACHLKSDTAVSLARQALDQFHARNGTKGRPLPTYAPRGQARTVRPAPSTPAVRPNSRGGSPLLAFIESVRRDIADLRRDAIRAGLSARQRPASSTIARGASVTHDGDLVLYGEDDWDEDDWEAVTTEEGQRRQFMLNFG